MIGYKVCIQSNGEYTSLNSYTPCKYLLGEEYTLNDGSAFFLYSTLEAAQKTAGKYGPIFKTEYVPSDLPIQIGSSVGLTQYEFEFRLPWDTRRTRDNKYRICPGSSYVCCHRDTVFASSVKLLERIQ